MTTQPTMITAEDFFPEVSMMDRALAHDSKGNSEEKCTRCGWVMGHSPLNCNNDNTPHVFPSQLMMSEELQRAILEVNEWLCDSCNTVSPRNPRAGVLCIKCPYCGSYDIGPKEAVLRRRAEKERDAYNAQIHRQYKTRDRAMRVLKVVLTGDGSAMRDVSKDHIAMDFWLSRDEFEDGDFDWMTGFINE